MPGLALGQLLGNPPHDLAHALFLDGPTDAETIEGQGADLTGRLSAQVFELRPLHHTKQRLVRAIGVHVRESEMLGNAPLRPFQSARHRELLIFA